MTANDAKPHDLLLKLYGFAIDEYRFEVRLNWDRSRDYLIVNLGLLSVATGLLRVDAGRAASLLVMLMFAIGAWTSFLGARAVATGHRYYRRTVFKKTLLEHQLGLLDRLKDFDSREATLAIGTTPGMADVERILKSPNSWINATLSRDSIVYYLMTALRFLSLANAAGAIVSGIRLYRLSV